MSPELPPSPPAMDWGVAALPLAGQAVLGDLHLVQPFPDGVLVAVVDGLGHGADAAFAAQSAVGILKCHAHESLISLVSRCHSGLLTTRGVVMSLASFNIPAGTMTWLGVGNVEGVLGHADAHARPRHASLLLRGGVVGYQLPPLRASALPVTRGDTLVFATDGITRSFTHERILRDPPQQIADRILAGYARGTDDALVLVARYLG